MLGQISSKVVSFFSLISIRVTILILAMFLKKF